MQKIASPQELQAELKAVMAFIHHSEKPDRQVVAAKIRELADRVAGQKYAARFVPIEKAKKGDMVEIEYKKEKVTGKVVRVKKDGVVTVDVEKSRSNPGGHSDEDVGYVDVRVASELRELADGLGGKTASVGDLGRIVSTFVLKESNDLHKNVRAWLKHHLKGEKVALPDGRLDDEVHDLIYNWDGKTMKPLEAAYNSMMSRLKKDFPVKKAGDNTEMVDRLVDRVAASDPYPKLAAKARAMAEACQEVAAAADKAAKGENAAPVDNMAMRLNTYEAKFRLFTKALKAAEGWSPKD